MKSAGEELLAVQLRALKITGWVREFAFAKPRRWRADFAHPESRLLVEVEGGVYSGGRHTRGSGFLGDIEKYNSAAMLGWSLLRFSSDMVRTGEAIKRIEQYLLMDVENKKTIAIKP